MMFFVLSLALADSGDSADTGVFVDTDARVEKVYTQQDEGCGGAKAVMVLPIVVLALVPRRRG